MLVGVGKRVGYVGKGGETQQRRDDRGIGVKGRLSDWFKLLE